MKSIYFLVAIALMTPAAQAQYGGYGGGIGMNGGFGSYGGMGGFGSFPINGFQNPINSFGAYSYSQQLFQQQSSLTQQIFQQQQKALLDEIKAAKAQAAQLDATKQRMFQQYMGMNEYDKASVRTGLMVDYLNLDGYTRSKWRQDVVVQTLIGQDLNRLDGVLQYQAMNSQDKAVFRKVLVQRYQGQQASVQDLWQNDPVLGLILGKEWWK